MLHFFGFYSNAQDCSISSVDVRSIKAIQTDSNIDFELFNHQVYFNPNCPQNDKLLVHLVGSFDIPESTSLLPTIASIHGYKVIALKYSNDVAAVSACADSADEDCYFNFRNEIVFGIDGSSQVDVDQSNAIINRLEKLLLHLDREYPTENWSQFISGTGDLNWSQILLSGHSQGGGHAAFMAQQFEVDRVLMFASPNDYSNFYSSPASWVSREGLTPSPRYFAFGNLFDEVVDFEKQFQVWTEMDLLMNVDSMNVDRLECNYNNAQLLYTRHTSGSGLAPNHSSVIRDEETPIGIEGPVFQPVWEYMLGVCQAVSTSEARVDGIKIFPNPAHDRIGVESDNGILSLEIFDISGNLITKEHFKSNPINLELELSQGMYFLRIKLASYKDVVFKKLLVN